MKKVIQFYDALGNIIQIKTVIDLFRELENKSCWITESRKIFPQSTNWGCYPPLENQFFNTDEEAQEAVRKHLLEYIEKSKGLKENIRFEEILL